MAIAAPELAALAALAACMFLIALYYSYGYTIGALLQALAAMFRRLSFNLWFLGRVGLGFIGDALDDVDKTIRNAIGAGITATRAGWIYFLHVSAYSFEWIGKQLGELAADTLAGLIAARDVIVPRLIAAALGPVELLVKVHSLLWRYLPEQVHRIMQAALRELHHAIAVAKSEAIALTLPGLRGLEREAGAVRARVKGLERVLAPAAIAGLVAVALSRIGLGWVKCAKVGRVGRRICGLDSGLLDALLLGTTVIVSSVSLVQWAELLLDVEDELVAGITGGFRELRGIKAG